LDFLKWQFGSRIVSGPVIHPWMAGAKFIAYPGETGITGNLYCGLHEFADMAYLLHAIRPDDLFVDIGANVGAYTILASATANARSYCFEPVPTTFERLRDNININRINDRVHAFNIGISDSAGELSFTMDRHSTVNHVLATHEQADNTIRIQTMPLDAALEGESPAIIKIDVEGFESMVLAGAAQTLAAESLHTVIMELNGSGQRYGFDEERIKKTMTSAGFSTYSYEPFSRTLALTDGASGASGNSLFIRNIDTVRARIRATPRSLIRGVHL
jgi:FkbM family methyltransferase